MYFKQIYLIIHDDIILRIPVRDNDIPAGAPLIIC